MVKHLQLLQSIIMTFITARCSPKRESTVSWFHLTYFTIYLSEWALWQFYFTDLVREQVPVGCLCMRIWVWSDYQGSLGEHSPSLGSTKQNKQTSQAVKTKQDLPKSQISKDKTLFKTFQQRITFGWLHYRICSTDSEVRFN